MTDSVTIRSALQQDTECILDIYRPYILHTPVSFETEVPTTGEFSHRITKYQENLPWLVCEINGVIAGYAYATNHRERSAYNCSKEMSVYVHEDYRKRGIATGLYAALAEILKLQGVTNVLAGITLPNPESVGFHEHFGFKPVGIYHNIGYKLSRFHDVGWWEMSIGSEPISFAGIRPVHELTDSDLWNKALKLGVSKIK